MSFVVETRRVAGIHAARDPMKGTVEAAQMAGTQGRV